MCKAFSGLVDFNDKVTWKLGVDSHSDLAKLGGYSDTQLGEFSKFEITPKNGDYLNPDEWVFRWDEEVLPNWCGTKQKELALAAHKKWLKQLEKFINRHPIVHPFEKAPPSIERKHILLLKKWDSVWGSVWDSVWGSVGGSVWDSIWGSVWGSVGDSIRDSVGGSVGGSVWDSIRGLVWGSVGDSIRAYAGSFFRIPVWKYVKHPKGKYPFQPLVTLWNQGLVPSFDGTTWRLHGGPKAAILFSLSKEDLEKYK